MQVFKDCWDQTPDLIKYCGAVTFIGGYLLWDVYKHYKKDQQIELLSSKIKSFKSLKNPTHLIETLTKPVIEKFNDSLQPWQKALENSQEKMNELLSDIKALVQEVKNIKMRVDDCDRDLTMLWSYVYNNKRMIYTRDKGKEHENDIPERSSSTGQMRYIPINESLDEKIKRIVEECLSKRKGSLEQLEHSFESLSVSPDKKAQNQQINNIQSSHRRANSCEIKRMHTINQEH